MAVLAVTLSALSIAMNCTAIYYMRRARRFREYARDRPTD